MSGEWQPLRKRPLGQGNRAKTAVKRAVKLGFRLCGGVLPLHRSRCRILTYHSIGHNAHDMTVTPEAFVEQMRWLSDNQDVVTMTEAAQGKPGVAITFDDGYRDNLENAAPLLAELGMPATVFVVAARVGQHLKDPPDDTGPLMTWEELVAIEGLGVEVGAHTMTHARLAALSLSEQACQITECKHALEDHLGHSIAGFAYPYGSANDYTNETVTLVREAGYSWAATNRYGPNGPDADLWALRRVWVDASDSIASFKAKVLGTLDGLRVFDSRAGLLARKLGNFFVGG